MPSITVTDVSLRYPVFGRVPAPRQDEQAAKAAAASDGVDWRGAGALIPASGRGSNHIEALRDINFKLGPGDRLGLLGRNGSGKSTLLRVLAGVYPPSAGSVVVDGRTAPMFNVGLGVRPEATGRRNIILRGLLNRLSHAEAKAKVDEIVAFSELGPYIDMPVRTYSSGMAMRLAFATSTAFSPEILLLDEWIGAGDESFQQKAATRMNELVAQSGITVIATHKRELIRKVCTLALWLDGGGMRAFGPVSEVFELWDEEERRDKVPTLNVRRVQAASLAPEPSGGV